MWGISITNLEKSTRILAKKLEELGLDVEVFAFRNNGCAELPSSYVELEISNENHSVIAKYVANGYGFPSSKLRGQELEFGQNQKWSEMKRGTWASVREYLL